MENRFDFNALRGRVWGPVESVEHPEGGCAWVRPPEISEIRLLHSLLLAEISPEAGTFETMVQVFAHNRDAFWLIEHLASKSEAPRTIGFYAFLPLNADGREALETHKLDTANPPLSMLTPFGEAPAALYVWAVVARRLLRSLMPAIARALGSLYTDAPIFARVVTEDGRKAGVGTGFRSAITESEIQVGSLMMLPPWRHGGAPS